MARIAKHYRARFSTVVSFQPTGWSHTQTRGKSGHGRRRQKGTLITYQVYRHGKYCIPCSFPSLRAIF